LSGRAGAAQMRPQSFTTPAAWRAWLEAHHDSSQEIFLRLFKVHAAHRGITYKQALDEALCFGWIDGIARRLDQDSYCQRFTPRRPRSIWSRVNVGHVERLIKERRMTQAGLAAYEKRDDKRTGVYAFEKPPQVLPREMEKRFRAKKQAWAFYQQQAPWYRRTTTHWVLNGKKEETRLRRLDALIACCARREIVPQVPTKQKKA
jgi:uncharacterized protein YdeI (YjbR/CyaY-like superfamily)